MLLVAAITKSANLDRFIEDYRQAVLPSRETNLALIEKHENFIHNELPDEYIVEWKPTELEREFL